MKLFKLLLKALFKRGKNSNIYLINYIFQNIIGINRNFPHSVHFTSQVTFPENIACGGGSKLFLSFAVSGHCYFSAYNKIIFGKDVLFAPGVKIISSNHSLSASRVSIKGPPVIIGDDVWIGANVVILPGVQIGQKSVIAAGAIVNRNIPEYCIVAGVPAKIIGRICECGRKMEYATNEVICRSCAKTRSNIETHD